MRNIVFCDIDNTLVHLDLEAPRRDDARPYFYKGKFIVCLFLHIQKNLRNYFFEQVLTFFFTGKSPSPSLLGCISEDFKKNGISHWHRDSWYRLGKFGAQGTWRKDKSLGRKKWKRAEDVEGRRRKGKGLEKDLLRLIC